MTYEDLVKEVRDRAMLLVRKRGRKDTVARNKVYRDSLIFTTDLLLIRYIFGIAELSVRIKGSVDRSGIQIWNIVLRDFDGSTDTYDRDALEAVAEDLRPLMVLDDLASI